MRSRRHVRPLRNRVFGGARVTVVIALVLALMGGGAAFAGYRYDEASADRVLPGVRIGTVAVGEMSRDDAIRAVSEEVARELDRPIEVSARGERWHVTPGELGTRVDVEALVDRAIELNGSYSWPSRVVRRLLDREVGETIPVGFSYDERRVERFVDTVAGAVEVSPSDAAVDFMDGELVLRPPKQGIELRGNIAQKRLMRALQEGEEDVRFGVRKVEPQVTRADLGQTIVVDLSELRLHLYEGVKLVKTYPVAAGQPRYPTPPGEWTVIDKRENPTWTNPAPDGWGAGLPAFIPGGPSNPLGTRALYLNAPGIRIHGTAASSSIGTYASHGCVRMLRTDVEELYPVVDVGTTVHVVL